MTLTILAQASVYLAFIVLIAFVGNPVTRMALHLAGKRTPPKEGETAATLRGGRVIGVLERLLIMIGLAASSLEVMIAVIALKSVARYNKLDQQEFAEYFLIGSMASILWAAVLTIVMIWYDRTWGLHLVETFLSFRRR